MASKGELAMGRKKQPEGTQRTARVNVRFKPDFREALKGRLGWLRQQPGFEKATLATLVRVAVFEYCKELNDPRTP